MTGHYNSGLSCHAFLTNILFHLVEVSKQSPLFRFLIVLGNRPSSQMSFLEQFLQESSEQGRTREPLNVGRSESSVERKVASTVSHGSIESDEPDQDTDVDNQIASVASSRSNMSETSVSN